MRVMYVMLVSLFCLLLGANGHGQNLVPNPSFEQLDFCPAQINQIHAATWWENWRGTPELFNTCSPNFNLPYTPFGYQWAHTGQSMGGLVGYSNPQGAAGPNIREYIATPLTATLILGQKYFMSFFMNLANFQGFFIAIDNIGIKLSTTSFSQSNPFPISDSAHIKYSIIANDTSGWLKCSGSFIADSGYAFLCVGNFYHDSLTSTFAPSSTPNVGYYFIDDICLSLDSNYTETWTNIHKVDKKTIIVVFPNPASDNLYIKTELKNLSLYITDVLGKQLLYSPVVAENSPVNISALSNGVYFIELKSEGFYHAEKLYINHQN